MTKVVYGAVLALVIGAMTVPARAETGLAVRLGGALSLTNAERPGSGPSDWSLGLQYSIPSVPSLLNGENWSTNLAVDYYTHVPHPSWTQAIDVSVAQVYNFEEQNGHVPYAGFCLSAVTMKQQHINNFGWSTRWGGGLVLGLEWNRQLFVEARLCAYVKGKNEAVPQSLKLHVGYKF